MRVIVGGALSLPPFSPGTAWDRLNHLLGLQALGHEAFLVEEVDPEWCVDERGRRCGFGESVNRARFCATLSDHDLLSNACLLYAGGEATAGLDRDELEAVVRDADLLLNISGHIRSGWVLEGPRRRAYVDQDPVFTQLWSAEYGADLNFEAHDVFFTTGLNIGTPACEIPDAGVKWNHCLPPIAPVERRSEPAPPGGRLTTIASWGRYEPLDYRGTRYGGKREELARFAELPRRAGQKLEVALQSTGEHPEDVERLRACGWRVTDAAELDDIASYRSYVSSSKGEICIAKSAYVNARAGWIGDRSCEYLASGRPVVAQSTGLERRLPVGEGLLTFSDVDEAVGRIEAVARDYRAHCQAAHRLVDDFLDARRVLGEMIEVALS